MCLIRTVLTGAGGYIGLHILRALLEARHQVTAVVRSPEKLGSFTRHSQLNVVETDLEDVARIARVLPGHDVCVHTAIVWGEPGDEFEVRDTAVAAKLFEAAGNAGLTRCLYLSSVAVHRPFVGEMSEDNGLSATDFYGATKAAGELFLRGACAEHKMTGVVVRPGPVVGLPAFADGSFRSDNRIAAMVAAAAAGRAIEVVRDDEKPILGRVDGRKSRPPSHHGRRSASGLYLCRSRHHHVGTGCAAGGRMPQVVQRGARSPAQHARADAPLSNRTD